MVLVLIHDSAQLLEGIFLTMLAKIGTPHPLTLYLLPQYYPVLYPSQASSLFVVWGSLTTVFTRNEAEVLITFLTFIAPAPKTVLIVNLTLIK
jgi:hypothetical protein